MVYKIDFNRWGRFFSVPCSVVDDYIKLSDGDFVKVLLCALCSNSDVIDTDVLAAQAGVQPSKAHDALLYWAGNGVVNLIDQQGKVVQTAPAPAPISAPASAPVKETAKPPKTVVRYSPKDLSAVIDSQPDLKALTDNIQQLVGRTLNAAEVAGIINLYEYYGFSPAAIFLITDYCHKLGKDRFAYVERVAKDWFERGIIEYSDVEAEIIRQSNAHTYRMKAAKLLGMSSKLSKRQGEFIDDWAKMGFTLEMLEIACDKCIDVKKEVNFNYIDGILKNWAGKAITTPEQVKQEDVKFSGGAKKKYTQHENKDTSYDLSEFEKFALNFDPNKRGDN